MRTLFSGHLSVYYIATATATAAATAGEAMVTANSQVEWQSEK